MFSKSRMLESRGRLVRGNIQSLDKRLLGIDGKVGASAGSLADGEISPVGETCTEV